MPLSAPMLSYYPPETVWTGRTAGASNMEPCTAHHLNSTPLCNCAAPDSRCQRRHIVGHEICTTKQPGSSDKSCANKYAVNSAYCLPQDRCLLLCSTSQLAVQQESIPKSPRPQRPAAVLLLKCQLQYPTNSHCELTMSTQHGYKPQATPHPLNHE